MTVKNKEKLVSIVIPIYNVENYLEECISSVINQTYKNLEIILVDDGSPDRCGEICDKYAQKDSRIKVIHKKNGGLSSARNVGFNNTTGDFVYFLDSDDYISKDTIEFLTRIMIDDNQLDFVFFDALSFNDNDKSDTTDSYVRKKIYIKDKSYKVFDKLVKNKEFKTCVPLLFFRKSFLKKNNLTFYDGILHEDELFTAKVFMYSNYTKHICHQFYFRRIHNDSIMTKKLSSRNFHGYYITIIELLNQLNNIIDDKEKYTVFEDYIAEKAKFVIQVYYQLDFKNRKKSKIEFDNLTNSIKKHFSNKNTSLSNVLKRRKKYFFVSKAKYYLKKPYLKYKDRYFMKRTKIHFNSLLSNYENDLNYIKQNAKNRKVIVLCTPQHGNLGDHAITLSEKNILMNLTNDLIYIELTYESAVENVRKIKKYIRKDDIFIINGGGWLGTLWYHDEYLIQMYLKHYKKNTFIIMPQTVYYDKSKRNFMKKSQKIYSKHKKLYVFLRDKKSYDFFIENKFSEESRTYYSPDVALYNKYNYKSIPVHNQIGICFRRDKEQTLKDSIQQQFELSLLKSGYKLDYFTTVLPQKINRNEREKTFNDFLSKISKNEVVITDRLHCMVFCYITNTPCIAFDNLSNKISGVHKWIESTNNIRLIENNNIKDLDIIRIINEIRKVQSEKKDLSYEEKTIINIIKKIIKMEEKNG